MSKLLIKNNYIELIDCLYRALDIGDDLLEKINIEKKKNINLDFTKFDDVIYQILDLYDEIKVKIKSKNNSLNSNQQEIIKSNSNIIKFPIDMNETRWVDVNENIAEIFKRNDDKDV